MADDIHVAVNAAGVAVVTLNRPEKRNVVSLAMWRGLGEIYRDFARRSDVRVVILTGAGGHFCGGADISEFSKVRNSVEDARSYGAAGTGGDAGHHRPAAADDRRGAWLRRGRRLRTGAGVRPARGRRDDADGHPGRAAVDRLRLAGLQPAAARRRAGERQAGARTRDAISRWPTAARWDLIDVVSEQGALPGAHALAQEFCTRAPLSQRGAKVVLEALDRGEVEQRAAEIAAVQEAAVNSEDYREARQAFLEKRTPAFKGR